MNYTSKNIELRDILYRATGLPVRNIFVCVITLVLLSFFGGAQAQAPTIGKPAVSGTPVCAGSTISVQFTITNGTGPSNHFQNPTSYYAYLSNGFGSFASPTIISFTNTTVPLPLDGQSVTVTQSLTIPTVIPSGSGYQISIESISPGVGGSGINPSDAFTIYALPTVDATGDQIICSGSTTNITLSGNVTGTTFAWTVTSQSGASGASAGSGTSIAQTLTATGTTAGTVVYSVTPTANACPGTPISVTITVNPTPVATATPSSEVICSGSATNIALSGNVTGTTFAWTVTSQSGASGASAGSGTSITQTLTATGTTPGTVVYSVVPTANACLGTPISVTITVNPIPAATATPSSQIICSGSATNIALSGNVTGTTFAWTVTSQTGASGASAGNGTSIAQTLSATGTTPGTVVYSVIPTANACQGTPISVTITVNPIPVATATPSSQIICSGTSTNIALSGNVTGTTFAWTVTSQSGASGSSAGSGTSIAQTLSATGTTPGSVIYSVIPTANACPGTPISVTITVNPIPVATATPSSQIICSGTATNIALSANVTGTTFAWTVTSQTGASGASAGNGTSIAQTLSATGSTPGTVVYSVIPTANACPGTPISVTITINPRPVGTATPSSQPVCSGTPTNIALSGDVAGTTFAWTVTSQSGASGASAGSGASIAQTLTATGTTPGTVVYSVTPTANGCPGTPISVTITVNPIPTITIGTINSVCKPPATTINVPYSAITGGANQYSIDFDDNTNTAGFIDVPYTTLNSAPGNMVINIPSGAAGGIYNATITVRNSTTGCVSTAYLKSFTVNTPPVITLHPVSEEYCRNNLSSTFTASATGYPTPTIQWQISTNNGSSWKDIDNATSLSYTFTPANKDDGNQYRAVFKNTCNTNPGVISNAAVLTINGGVNLPGQDFNAYMCQGASSATFAAKATGGVGQAGVLSYYWEYSVDGNPPWTKIPGTDGTNPNSGNFTSTYTATAGQLGYHFRLAVSNNGCLTYTPGGVVVTTPIPTAMNTPPGQIICAATSTQAVTFSGSTNVTFYSWVNTNTAIGLAASGRGNIPSFTAQNAGAAPITGTITVTPYDSLGGGVICAGPSTQFTITVNPAPACSITGNNNVCPGSTNTYTAPAGMAAYAWSITGNASISGANNAQTVSVLTGTACGDYTLTLITTNSYNCTTTCNQTFTATDVIKPTVTGSAAITIPGCNPPNPSSSFVTPTPNDNCGTTSLKTGYPLDGTVTSGGNCSNSQTRTWIYVDACGNESDPFVQTITWALCRPTITGNLNVCIGFTSQLTGSGTPAVSNPWVSASPAVATINSSGLVTGVSPGTSIITYTDINGCSQTITVTVTPDPTPTIYHN